MSQHLMHKNNDGMGFAFYLGVFGMIISGGFILCILVISIFTADFGVTKISAHPRTIFPPSIGSPAQGMVSLNFDDGFLSAYENGIPILEKAGMRSTIYLIDIKHPLYMTKEQALELQSRGHEIGSHTRRHDRLSGLTESRVLTEVDGVKKDLEKKGLRIETFAYPYGDYNQKVLSIVKEAGFVTARGTRSGFNDEKTDPFQLYSKSIEKGVSIEEIRDLIDSAIEEKKWLIFAFHRIGHEDNKVNATPEMLEQIVDYLIEKDVPVVTTREGYELVFKKDSPL